MTYIFVAALIVYLAYNICLAMDRAKEKYR